MLSLMIGWKMASTCWLVVLIAFVDEGGRLCGVRRRSISTVIVILCSVASGLRNCGNPTKCIYQPHKWKASAPIHLQKMRMGCFFQQSVQPFSFSFLFCQHCNQS